MSFLLRTVESVDYYFSRFPFPGKISIMYEEKKNYNNNVTSLGTNGMGMNEQIFDFSRSCFPRSASSL